MENRFNIDKLEDRIAPSILSVSGGATATTPEVPSQTVGGSASASAAAAGASAGAGGSAAVTTPSIPSYTASGSASGSVG